MSPLDVTNVTQGDKNVTAPRGKRCGQCASWVYGKRPLMTGADGYAKHAQAFSAEGGAHQWGECRIRAVAQFPVRHKDDWCHEYSTREHAR